uniref:Nucleotide-diphospho-sugar transferase domain-containing protein n=1 Tax=Phenylobacterium glaciei TaxID=2803784 RepID=A0A974P2X5_9CAUL|nr:hypothetical protein JKL49_25025 [Phenylobacterium glaciei]
MDVVFTIVSRNYQAQAATLMESLAVAEPGVARVVIATDGPMAFADPGIRVIEAGGIVANFAAMCAYYDALELNTAVKPHAFRALLAEAGVGSVVYLDPDIFVYRPLAEVREGLARAPLVLTPHMTRPLRGAANPNDHVILTSGSYNLGFMAVRNEPQIETLLEWWAEKLEFDCRVDFAAGLFTDQKWIDLAPGLVSDLALLRTPALNLAYWNLEGRELTRDGDSWRVDGESLGFFHFSGFDPARPELLSKHQDRIKILAGSALADLLKDYAADLLRNGHAQAKATPYGHRAFPSGRLIMPDQRRRMLAAARGGEDFGGGLTAAAETWLLAPRGGPVRQPVGAPDGPWLAASDALAPWLTAKPDLAINAMRAARKDLRDRFTTDPIGLRAWLLGPEALAGRFDARLLAGVGADIVGRAVGYALGETPDLRSRPMAWPIAPGGLRASSIRRSKRPCPTSPRDCPSRGCSWPCGEPRRPPTAVPARQLRPEVRLPSLADRRRPGGGGNRSRRPARRRAQPSGLPPGPAQRAPHARHPAPHCRHRRLRDLGGDGTMDRHHRRPVFEAATGAFRTATGSPWSRPPRSVRWCL